MARPIPASSRRSPAVRWTAMSPHGLINGLLAGGAALVFGLVPGLVDDFAQGLRNLGREIQFGASKPQLYRARARKAERSLWLAGLGAAIIVLTIVGFFWS